jgi:hypothetical protein
MWPSPRWGLNRKHALLSLVAGAAVGCPCAQALGHCMWGGDCPHPNLYFVGFFVGITGFLAGALALIQMREMGWWTRT